MTPTTVQYHAQKASRQKEGLCAIPGCPNRRVVGFSKCDKCRANDRAHARVQMDRIEARTGARTILPEWKILEIEANQKEFRERQERLNEQQGRTVPELVGSDCRD